VWDLVQPRTRLGQWRKCLIVVMWASQASSRGTLGRILLRQTSGERFQPFVAVRVELVEPWCVRCFSPESDLERRSALPENRAGQTARQAVAQRSRTESLCHIAPVCGCSRPRLTKTESYKRDGLRYSGRESESIQVEQQSKSSAEVEFVHFKHPGSKFVLRMEDTWEEAGMLI
jgi:hypothetical protein